MAAYQAGEYGAAIQMLGAARERDALSATGWEVLGSSLWASSRPDLAVNTWLAGTRAHPDAPELWDRLAAAYHAQREYDIEQAALQRRLELREDAGAQYRLGLLLVGWDDAGALAALDEAARLDAAVIPAAGDA